MKIFPANGFKVHPGLNPDPEPKTMFKSWPNVNQLIFGQWPSYTLNFIQTCEQLFELRWWNQTYDPFRIQNLDLNRHWDQMWIYRHAVSIEICVQLFELH